MVEKIRARFSRGVLLPLEPLDLEDGEEVTVSIGTEPQLSDDERLRITQSAAGGWKGSHDAEELKRMLYEARLAGSQEPVNL